VTTSRPTPRSFTRAYAAAVAAGATGIVSVHLSEKLSSTIDAARIAATTAGVPVEVVDAGGVGMATGFAVLAALHASSRGLEAAVEAATSTAAGTRTFFSVETLEHLRRGGRITARQAILGTALSVKPILHVVNGTIELLEKVRTTSRAVAHLEARVIEAAGEGAVDIAVHHLQQEARAQELADRLRERVPGLRELYLAEVGAVLVCSASWWHRRREHLDWHRRCRCRLCAGRQLACRLAGPSAWHRLARTRVGQPRSNQRRARRQPTCRCRGGAARRAQGVGAGGRVRLG